MQLRRIAVSTSVGWLILYLCLSSLTAQAGTQVTSFGSNPGNLDMYKYVPSNIQSPAPVVVLLHGCTQNANTFESETGWQELAEEWGLLIVSAGQKSSNNSSSCFNWFETGDINRGFGEALSIKQMVDKMKADYTVDDDRVYVVGFSAGAGMAAVMLATYPDVFAGGAIMAGIPYECGTGTTAAFNCMNPGVNNTPATWGNKVEGASSHSGPWPLVSIWHGDGDFTVRPNNATELVDQWTDVHGIDQVADVEDTVQGYPHKVYKDSSGNALVELYTITGMGHAYPVDPGSGENQGGSTGAYTTDEDIFASYYVGKFWGLDHSDSEAPTVSISSPSDGASVSGSVTISASASDNVGVDRVEFYIDGILASTDASSPYSHVWNTTNAANGDHSLLVRAYDGSGNVGTSATIEVTVSGGIEDVTPPTVSLTFPNNGDTVHGTVSLTATANDDFGVTSVEFFVDSISIGTGTPSGQAGPWELTWNTTGVSEGQHTVQARAYDANGNEGVSSVASITVDQDVLALDETWSDLDNNSDSLDADSSGWSSSGFSSSSENHTMAGSGSVTGSVSSGSGCQTGERTESISRSVSLGDNPILTYWRKLDLNARVNLSTYAAFRVKVNGTVVDEQTATYADYSESAWTEREVDLTVYGDQTVTLSFEIAAYSNICLAVTGEAWIDDIVIANPTQDEDTSAPSVNLTSPSNGATVSGSIDITASASDNVGVSKVEFYVDGNLIGVDSSSPYSLTWNTSDVTDDSHNLMTKAYDAAGNIGTDNDTTVTVDNSGGGGGGGQTTTSSFNNNDSQDGYVKATASGGSAATGSSFMESYYGLAIGRGSDGKFNRSILSFDTSSIPSGVTITRAWVTVNLNSSSGDPWGNPSGNSLVIDVRDGCFSSSCGIQTADWNASDDASAVATLLKWTSGSQSSGDFSAAGLNAINTSGTTQVRLRFTGNQTATNYIFMDNGTSATLTVEYQ